MFKMLVLRAACEIVLLAFSPRGYKADIVNNIDFVDYVDYVNNSWNRFL